MMGNIHTSRMQWKGDGLSVTSKLYRVDELNRNGELNLAAQLKMVFSV